MAFCVDRSCPHPRAVNGARAQTPDPQPPGPAPDPVRPPLNPFPAEQNWNFLADASKRTDFFDPVNYISLGDNPQLYLSLGFEYRIEYEYFDNWMFGAGPQDHNGYVMNRVMPHFDFHAGSDFRLFSEFEFVFEDGRTGRIYSYLARNIAKEHPRPFCRMHTAVLDYANRYQKENQEEVNKVEEKRWQEVAS